MELGLGFITELKLFGLKCSERISKLSVIRYSIKKTVGNCTNTQRYVKSFLVVK
jgi:hypothetical protein